MVLRKCIIIINFSVNLDEKVEDLIHIPSPSRSSSRWLPLEEWGLEPRGLIKVYAYMTAATNIK